MDSSWLHNRSRISFHHATKTLPLTLKTGDETTLEDICKSVTPPCQLNPLLFNGHLQTLWTSVKEAGPPISYKRKIFESDDPRFAGTYAVDFVVDVPPHEPDTTLPPRTTNYTDKEFDAIGSDDTKPMLISLHGLSGGSHEIYLRHVLQPLVGEGGWEAIVINSRGCAMSKITTPLLYNARATWDMRQTVKWCRETFPNRPLFAIGYSLGANILCNYLGEEGDACELKAAVLCSSPWKLEISNAALQRTLIGREVYSKFMAGNLKKLFERHAETILKNENIDAEEVRSVKYLHEFDRAIQCPLWGYPTEGAYYRDASSQDAVFAIKIPVFVIHAEDDPIAVNEAVPYEEIKQSPYFVCCSTAGGGHLSWFETGGSRWFTKPAAGFLEKMASEVQFEKLKSADEVADGSANTSAYKSPFVFEPMRRRMHLPG